MPIYWVFIILAVIVAINAERISKLVMGTGKGKQIVIKLCTPFLSFAASSLFVTWGRFLTFEDLFWKLSCSLTLAVLVWMSVLCCWKLYDYHKNDGI